MSQSLEPLALTPLGPAPQIAAPAGRAIFQLRGMPTETLVDVVACGLIAAGGSMSAYRDGAFLWCARMTFPHAEQVCTTRGLIKAGAPCLSPSPRLPVRGEPAPRASHARRRGVHSSLPVRLHVWVWVH